MMADRFRVSRAEQAVARSIIALFAIKEGREAWEGELVEDDGDDD